MGNRYFNSKCPCAGNSIFSELKATVKGLCPVLCMLGECVSSPECVHVCAHMCVGLGGDRWRSLTEGQKV